jgi:cold shock CspA family protein
VFVHQRDIKTSGLFEICVLFLSVFFIGFRKLDEGQEVDFMYFTEGERGPIAKEVKTVIKKHVSTEEN